MATLSKKRIKDVFNDSLKNVRSGKMANVSGIMLQHGYSPSSARALKVTQTKTWQDCLAQIDDDEIIKKFQEIVRSEDKRSAIAAGIELLKLKDRYPANKMKLSAYKEETEGIIE